MKEYQSFGAFAAHMVRLAAIGEAVTESITVRAAELIKDDARARIGIYQERTGNFNGWAPLADSTKADRVSQGYSEDEPLLREGVLRDSIVVEAHHNEAVIGSADEIALYQEVGTERGIPPRPFLGPAAYDSRQHIGVLAANAIVAWVSGRGFLRPAQSIKLP